MGEIYTEAISVNRNAPEDVSEVNLYGYNGVERMTLSQLINAMVVRRCACLESQSVISMNLIATDVDKIDAVSSIANRVLAGAWGPGDYDYLVSLKLKNLPASVATYTDRMQAMEAIRTKLEELNSSLDRTAIELQTSVSRRDSMYNLATTMCSRASSSMMQMAGTM